MKLNAKQIAIIAASLVIGFVINWLMWLGIMRHPNDIAIAYHLLTTICLAAALVHVGDRLLNAQIFK